jgi:hypothetical protein
LYAKKVWQSYGKFRAYGNDKPNAERVINSLFLANLDTAKTNLQNHLLWLFIS